VYHVRFRDPAGAVRRGEWTDEGVRFGGEEYGRNEVDVLPPVEPSKLVCVGRNYADHAAEHGADVPDRPMLFLKPANAVAGHGDTVRLPGGKERLDWEAELGVVIGEQCKGVSEADAEEVVAGYTCVNDLSNRDDQNAEQNWVRGKAFDGAAPLGPVVADPEHVPADASVGLRVNGGTEQDGSRDRMVFSVPELIAEITAYLTLEPGDVIATGTPEGVGPLSDGDRVEVEVEGIPPLEHEVRIP
jgi:2-keto-4-pentenoate hydratase/2-oxohepta-3-ene-1,7-dioic acid hydratase in catechol pathway